MVLPPSAADSEAVDQTLRVIATGLRLAGPSLMVLIRDAPDHAIGEMIRWLDRQGWRADVALNPLTLIDADPERVWILPARARQAALLNELRPRLRGIRLVLWIAHEEAELLANAPDFVDWASHFAACPIPWRTPSFITAGFAAARANYPRIHWDDDAPPPARPELGDKLGDKLVELRYWRDLCEQAADPSRSHEPIVRVPPIPFFVRRGGWALIDLETQAARVLWSPGAKAYGWWRIHGQSLAIEEAAEILGAVNTVVSPGSESAGDSASTHQRVHNCNGLRLAALCDGEPERVALAAWLLGRGHRMSELERATLTETPEAPGAALIERALAEHDVDKSVLASRFGPWGLEPIPGLIDAHGPTPLAHRHLVEDVRDGLLKVIRTILGEETSETEVSNLAEESAISLGILVERFHPKEVLWLHDMTDPASQPWPVHPLFFSGLSKTFFTAISTPEFNTASYRESDLSASFPSNLDTVNSAALMLSDNIIDGLDNPEHFTIRYKSFFSALDDNKLPHHLGTFDSRFILIELYLVLRDFFRQQNKASRSQLADSLDNLEERLLYNCRDNIPAADLHIALTILANVLLERWESVYGWTQNLLAEEVFATSPQIQALAGYAAAACGALLVAISHFSQALHTETRTARRRQLLADTHQLLARIPDEVTDGHETSLPHTATVDPEELLATLSEDLRSPRISTLLAPFFAKISEIH